MPRSQSGLKSGIQVANHASTAYALLCTRDESLAARFQVLHPAAACSEPAPGLRCLAAGLATPSLRRINGSALEARATLSGARFQASADFWGLQNHYFLHRDGTFAAGDDIFTLKALLVSPRLDHEALLESLFFTAPLGSRTWFQDVRCLQPGQLLRFDAVADQLELDAGTDFNAWFDEPGGTLLEEARAFYQDQRRLLGDTPAHLSLSAGSDSRAILAGLRHFEFTCKGFCFGGRNYLEKDKVAELARRLGLELGFIELTDYEQQFEANFSEGMRLSNGYLNPLRTHYLEYYRKLPATGVFFEGILGSEFVKGEISWPTMTSKPMKQVIADGRPVDEVVATNFPELEKSLRRELATYVQDVHGALLTSVNAPGGSRAYSEFAFRFIPRRIFAGVVPLAQARMPVVYPYLHPPLLRAVFQAGHGIRHSSSLDRRFPTALKSIVPEAHIVQAFDAAIFGMRLDRGISYRQSLYPRALGSTIRAFNLLFERALQDRNKFAGQIDNTRIIQRIGALADGLEQPVVAARKPGGNLELARQLVSYDLIQRL